MSGRVTAMLTLVVGFQFFTAIGRDDPAGTLVGFVGLALMLMLAFGDDE